MNSDPIVFNRVTIAPFECLSESWNRIRDQYWLFVGICAVGVLLGSFVPMGILMGPMFCGMYFCYLERWRNRPVSFNLLFKGFEGDLFLQSLIATLILMASSMLIVVPLMVIAFASGLFVAVANTSRHGSDLAPALIALLVVGVVVLWMIAATLLGVFFVFTYPLIVDRRMSGLDAVKLSASAAWANVWGLLGLSLLTMTMALVGMFCCYVGAFLVMPVTFGALTAAYAKVFGLSESRPGVLA